MNPFRLPAVFTIAGKLIEFEVNQRSTRAQLQARQLRKFRRLAARAARRSPHYAEVVRSRRIDLATCTPADFPVLTKSDLMENFDRIATDRRITRKGVEAFLADSVDPGDLYLGEYQICHTSGSSGEVGYFVFGHGDWARATAQHARVRGWPPFLQPETVAFVGATDGHFAGVSAASTARRGINGLVRKVILCEVNDPLSATIERLNAFQPQVVIGYAAILCTLAEKQREGQLRIAPRRIDSSGEPLTDADRELLASAFGAQVFNLYVCAEHQLVAVGRPGRDGMLVLDDDLILEFHDDCLVVTNLFNHAMPLIRYRMGDVVQPRLGGASQGFAGPEGPIGPGPYAEIETVRGRSEMVPQFVNRRGESDFISPHTINEIYVRGVRRFQMELTGVASFRFLARLDEALDAAERAAAVARLGQRLHEILDRKGLEGVTFEVVEVEDLPIDPETRKFRLIVDRRPPPQPSPEAPRARA